MDDISGFMKFPGEEKFIYSHFKMKMNFPQIFDFKWIFTVSY